MILLAVMSYAARAASAADQNSIKIVPTPAEWRPTGDSKMPVIDADSHVVETERTWTFMPDEQEEYRPAVLARKSGRTRASEYWLIDDRVFAKNANIGQDTPEAAREAAD
ncbi:MAG TPA: hypothetical protein VEK81_01565, partial [Burkholderiales bacterium]|nr:hypothetical protein [Burkholderiales bacterium]